MANEYNVNVSNEGEIRGTISAEQEVRGSLLETVLRGYSAYELAVKNGFVGTMEEWIASLKGDIGLTPDVQIGDVVTGEPGTDASASMTGTPEEPILNLTIPRGDVGATPDIQVGDVVTGLPGSDASASMTGTPEEPLLNLTIPRGDKGDPGEDAVNPVVSSSKDGGVTTVEITDATHTETLTINDGYTPQKDVDYFDGHSPSITTAKSQGTTFIYSDGEQIGAVQDGVDGYTPRKNVDYFDGHSPVLTGSKVDKVTTIKSDGVVIGQIEDGYTPQKGIDYVDGNTPNITAQRNQNTVGIYADGVQIATISDGDDGHSPVVTASKSGRDTTILVDNTPIATISDGNNGDVGDPGVYVGENEPTDPDVQLWIDTDGTPNYDIPTGGSTGQVLTKTSGDDYDVEWANVPTDSVQDVQVNGTSVVNNGISNIPVANNTLGVVKVNTGTNSGIYINPQTGEITTSSASIANIKEGTNVFRPLSPSTQHGAVFYGLAKAAGDTTQPQSSNAVGTYTDEAKTAIQTMLDVPSTSDVPSIDNTLSVTGAAADAKKVGDELTSLNGDLTEFAENNSKDYTATGMSRTTGTHNSVTFTWSGLRCTVSGKATGGVAYNNYYVNNSKLPNGMVAGGKYYLDMDGQNVYVSIYKYVSGGSASQFLNDAYKSQWFTVPSDAVGLIIRLCVKNGVTASETVEPKIFNAYSNKRLGEIADDHEIRIEESDQAVRALFTKDLGLSFVQGALSAADGSEQVSNAYIRSGYFQANSLANISITCNSTYTGIVIAYTKNGSTYTKATTYTINVSSETIVNGNDSYYYRIGIKHADNSNIAPSEAGNVPIKTVPRRTMSDNNYTDEDKSKVDDAATMTEVVGEIEQALFPTSIETTFVQGGIQVSDGQDFASDNFIRSNYFQCSSGAKISVSLGSSLTGFWYEYTKSGNTYTKVAYNLLTSGATTLIPGTNGHYYRLSIKHPDGSAILPSEGANITVGTVPAKVLSDNNYSNADKATVDRVSDFIANDLISPAYEQVPFTIPSELKTNLAWSDIVIANGKMYFFVQSTGEEHASADGKIYVYNMSTWTKEKTITHDFGHVNTCSFDSASGALLIGNLPGGTTYPAALYIFYDFLDWNDGDTVRFSTEDKAIIDLSGWTDYTRVSACWGEQTGDERRIVYIASRYYYPFTKIILGTGTNQLDEGTYSAETTGRYNGTFKVLLEADTSDAFPSDEDGVWQGCEYYKGKVLTCNGDQYVTTANLWHFNTQDALIREIVGFPIYDGDGDLTDSIRNLPEGIAYNPEDGYIYMGFYYNSTWHLVRYQL